MSGGLRRDLQFDPVTKKWVPRNLRTEPVELPKTDPSIGVRLAACEQKGIGDFGGDGGGIADGTPGFPYGSQWWMGWTSVGAVVTIHNVMLHYQRGALMSEPSEFNCFIEGTTYVGFQIVFATGAFSVISSGTTDAFLQSGDGDGVFKFPVYRFVATTSGTPPVTRVEMLSDYVHGSNLGGF